MGRFIVFIITALIFTVGFFVGAFVSDLQNKENTALNNEYYTAWVVEAQTRAFEAEARASEAEAKLTEAQRSTTPTIEPTPTAETQPTFTPPINETITTTNPMTCEMGTIRTAGTRLNNTWDGERICYDASEKIYYWGWQENSHPSTGTKSWHSSGILELDNGTIVLDNSYILYSADGDNSVYAQEDGVRLRADATIESEVLSRLDRGQMLTMTGPILFDKPGSVWAPVQTESGLEGWVSIEFLGYELPWDLQPQP